MSFRKPRLLRRLITAIGLAVPKLSLQLGQQVPGLLAVKLGGPAKSVEELITLAGGKPGTLSYASSSVGSTWHPAGALFSMIASQVVARRDEALMVKDLNVKAG